MRENVWSRHRGLRNSTYGRWIEFTFFLQILYQFRLHLVAINDQERVEDEHFKIVNETEIENISASLVENPDQRRST